jgi:hypothetical protein
MSPKDQNSQPRNDCSVNPANSEVQAAASHLLPDAASAEVVRPPSPEGAAFVTGAASSSSEASVSPRRASEGEPRVFGPVISLAWMKASHAVWEELQSEMGDPSVVPEYAFLMKLRVHPHMELALAGLRRRRDRKAKEELRIFELGFECNREIALAKLPEGQRALAELLHADWKAAQRGS